MTKKRPCERAHPWLTLRFDLRRLRHTDWLALGGSAADCRQIATAPAKLRQIRSDPLAKPAAVGGGAGPYLRLMRLDRPVGTLLLLWPTLAALWMAAEGVPGVGVLFAFVVGTFLARSAGCVVNDIADRRFDGAVERTRGRPLPAGEISLAGAVALLLLLGALCAAVAWMLNPLSRALAAVGAAVAVAYPFCKRWTHWPQAALGVAFSWGIPMAFAAVTGAVPVDAWLLFAASFLWIVGYDTLYAMVDREDDEQIGVKSTAVLFGAADRAAVAVLQGATLGLLAWLGARLAFALPYHVGLAAIAGLFAYQQWLIRRRERAACFRAFANNAWVGFALFVAVVVEYAAA